MTQLLFRIGTNRVALKEIIEYGKLINKEQTGILYALDSLQRSPSYVEEVFQDVYTVTIYGATFMLQIIKYNRYTTEYPKDVVFCERTGADCMPAYTRCRTCPFKVHNNLQRLQTQKEKEMELFHIARRERAKHEVK